MYEIMKNELQEKVKEVLKRYGTKRAHSAISSNTGYYDFMVGTKRVHIRLSDHLKDTREDDLHYDIQVISGSGDTWILKYGKFLITRSGDDFVKYLDSFLYTFPDLHEIIDSASTQVEDMGKLFSEAKTAYEEERKAFREYKASFPGLEALEEKLSKQEVDLKGKDKIIENLESGLRSAKDRISVLESGNIGFRLLTDLKQAYGKLLEDINDGLKEVKKVRLEYENQIIEEAKKKS